jgi:hypothetical protein
LDNGTYYWRVVGRNASDGCDVAGNYSETRSVTINATKTYLPLVQR